MFTASFHVGWCVGFSFRFRLRHFWLSNGKGPRQGLLSGGVPDCRLITTRIWDLATVACVATLGGPEGCVGALAVLESGRLASESLVITRSRCGYRRGVGAPNLALRSCLDIADGSHVPGNTSAGISLDFVKAFPYVPHRIFFAVMERRGASPCIIRGLQGLYSGLRRRYRLLGCLGETFACFGSMLEGCAFSAPGLNCRTTA